MADSYGWYAWTSWIHLFHGDTVMHLAVKFKRLETVRALLRLHPKLDIKNVSLLPPLLRLKASRLGPMVRP